MEFRPRRLVLQWHVTERCNRRCGHCYQGDDYTDELDYSSLLYILEQYLALLRKWNSQKGLPGVYGHINLTGGEPFLREDFPSLLDHLARYRAEVTMAVLTNGSLVDRTMAARLRRWGLKFVQVSLDGDQALNDDLRGPGAFAETVQGVRALVRGRLRTLISFTAHGGNYRSFPAVAALSRTLKVNRLWADRYIPMARKSGLEILSPVETRDFFRIMAQARREHHRHWFNRTEVAMSRALQFLVAGAPPYSCTAGRSLLAVQANGDVYPCRRLPIKLGNLLETSLEEIYNANEFLTRLRDPHLAVSGCGHCEHQETCRGGLRCLAHAVTGDPFQADPGCWLAHQEVRS